MRLEGLEAEALVEVENAGVQVGVNAEVEVAVAGGKAELLGGGDERGADALGAHVFRDEKVEEEGDLLAAVPAHLRLEVEQGGACNFFVEIGEEVAVPIGVGHADSIGVEDTERAERVEGFKILGEGVADDELGEVERH